MLYLSNKFKVSKEDEGYRVAIYVRVSTNDQHSSVENQQQLFTSLLERNKWILHRTYTDEGISGTKSDKRLLYKEMVEDGKNKEYDILIAKSYSRFARNQRESLTAIADLMQAGVRIIFVEDVLDSKKDYGMFGLFGWLAEQEARKTSERLKTIWNHYDELGKIHVPKPPYGYSYNKEIQNYEIIQKEKDVVLSIFKMYMGGMGCRGIALTLNRDEIPTQKGVKWSQPTIANMLTNYTYTGCLVQGKSETIDVTMKKSKKKDIGQWKMHPYNHEAIIAPEIFFRVQEEVKKRSELVSENGRPVRHSNTALFSTVVKCKLCGSTCTIKRQKHFRNYSPYYACIAYEQNGRKGCDHDRVTIFEKTLALIIQGEVKKLVDTEYKVIRDSFSKIKETRKPKNTKSNLKAIEEVIQEKAKLSMTLLTSYSKGILGEAQFRLQNEMIEADIQKCYKEKENLERELSTFVVTIDKEQELINEINKLAKVDASEWTNAMIKEVIEKIEIDNNGNVEVYLKYHLDEKIPPSSVTLGNTASREVCVSSTEDYQVDQPGYLNLDRLRGHIKDGYVFGG